MSSFAIVSVLFTVGRFSFGYFLGFYFYTMIVGYLWLVEFSLLPYNHSLAIVSIFLSALAFLATRAVHHVPDQATPGSVGAALSIMLLSLILILGASTVAVGAFVQFQAGRLSEIYKFREGLEFPALLRYAIGMTSNALLPFAFACFVARGNRWRAGAVLLLLLLLYPITLTKMTLFAPFWLLFLTLLSRLSKPEPRLSCRCFCRYWAGIAFGATEQSRCSSVSAGVAIFRHHQFQNDCHALRRDRGV